MGCEVTFKVADHGKRVTGFTAADGYNHLCHFTTANTLHIFRFLVKWPPMKTRSNGSFTGTAKATSAWGGGPTVTGTFRVKGRFSSGKAHGTITRLHRTCGSYARNPEGGQPLASASNPATSPYAETFTAKRT